MDTRAKSRISNVQYVVDSSGKRIAVIIPLEEYSELLEDLHDLAIIAERKYEPTVTFEDVKRRVRECGIIQD